MLAEKGVKVTNAKAAIQCTAHQEETMMMIFLRNFDGQREIRKGLGAQDKDNTALRGGNKNPREEMAKLQSIAVYAAAMGGVNDSAGL
ncbi:hypothetical protein DPMN_118296 [Dreissena polymorpha]|uniref:Uncharacterized protein n=1 Tax=Dreissena polymorpha TaxID=45954 RepID=A0A9D4GH72_DREPO|nr:hypothetical protein DPMN_118296 [Dreissena polymorpha]